MSITDELRDWFKDRIFMANGWQEIHDIADRIDAEHEAACAEAYGNGVMSVPIALDESQWVKLPVDAEGKPIRIGDEVDGDHHEDGTVTGIQFYEMANGGIRTLIAVRPDGWDVATWHTPDEYRHHHEPTVENVLRDFGVDIAHALDADPDATVPEAIIAEYAAKLRLAGDAQ